MKIQNVARLALVTHECGAPVVAQETPAPRRFVVTTDVEHLRFAVYVFAVRDNVTGVEYLVFDRENGGVFVAPAVR